MSSAFAFGFQSTLGSFAASAIAGIVVMIGILLIVKSKDPETEERNTVMFSLGIAMVIVGALPFLPIFGLSLLLDQDW